MSEDQDQPPIGDDETEASPDGEDPRAGSSEEGLAILEKALAVWTEWVEELARTEDTSFLREFYKRRNQDYAPYVRTYFVDSWEQAIVDWWMTRG